MIYDINTNLHNCYCKFNLFSIDIVFLMLSNLFSFGRLQTQLLFTLTIELTCTVDVVRAEDGHLGHDRDKVLDVELLIKLLNVTLERQQVHDDDVFEVDGVLQVRDGIVLKEENVRQDGALVEQV